MKKWFLLIFIVLSICIISIVEINNLSKKHEVNIVSYNIHGGLDKNKFPTLFDIIDFLKVLNSDIVCLQEVNESVKAGFQVSIFKDELSMDSHFGANVVNSGTNYGLVTYSKYPIKSKDHIYLTSEKEQRGFLHTVVKVGSKKLNIINLHLALNKSERDIQLYELTNFIKSLNNEPYIVCGDFNQKNMEINKSIFKDVAKEVGKENIITISTGVNRIDYILVSPDIEVLYYDVLIKDMSDHYPIVAKIRI